MTPTKKKKYIKPEVKNEKIIETAALACGKCISGNPVNQAACRTFKKIS